MSRSDSKQWKTAIQEELNAHNKNNTWIYVDRNNNMNIIGCKWVFKIKRDMNGNIQKYKARLVAKGYNQEYGIDYDETFAPVLKYKSLRLLLALSTIYNTELEQLDIKTAFLNATINEDIYIESPEGMDTNGQVLKLNKALYGIKQAPKAWNDNINDYLYSLGFKACNKDTCIYVKMSKHNNNIILAVFVDDILVSYTTENEDEWSEFTSDFLVHGVFIALFIHCWHTVHRSHTVHACSKMKHCTLFIYCSRHCSL